MNELNKNDIRQGYTNLKRIIDFYINKHKISYASGEKAPSTYKDMVRHFNNTGVFNVYSGGDHGYLGQEYNIRFRAVHDYMHYTYNLTFNFEDEKKLSDLTAGVFRKIAWNDLNMTYWECYVISCIIEAEIRGQIEYYELNKKYVDNQAEFIDTYLKVG